MLREVAGWEVAGGVAVQLKMQRARARMQTDELMVTHYEDIGRDLQWVVRGGGDQAQKDVAVAMLQKLTNREAFNRREREAGTSVGDMRIKLSFFMDVSQAHNCLGHVDALHPHANMCAEGLRCSAALQLMQAQCVSKCKKRFISRRRDARRLPLGGL